MQCSSGAAMNWRGLRRCWTSCRSAADPGRGGRAAGSPEPSAPRLSGPPCAAKFADVTAQSGKVGSQFTSGDAAALLKSLASVGLTLGGHPAGVLGLAPDQLAGSAQAAGHLSDAAARAVTGKKPGQIPLEEYDLVTDPARELPRRIADALRAVAATVPLVIFLDTGEVIGGVAWGRRRRVMAPTGPRGAWVAGARLEAEAEA